MHIIAVIVVMMCLGVVGLLMLGGRWLLVLVVDSGLSVVWIVMVIKLVVGSVAALLVVMLDLLGVVVKDANEVESHHADDEEVKAYEDPDEVVCEISTSIPPVKQL